MKSVKYGTVGVLVGCVALSMTGAAFAQEATTTTTTTVAPAPATAQPAPVQNGMALPGAAPATPPPGISDHDLMAGHFGIGYMGFRSMQIGGGATVDAPVIGGRYWLDSRLGIDAGLGMNFSGGSTTTNPGGMSNDTQGYSVFILHGGIPIALAGSQHFSFQVVPEMNLGFASSTVHGAPDTDLSGIHLDLGARAGAEVHFGFIGIPELALQAGVGLAFRWDHTKTSTGGNSTSTSQTSFGTNTGDNPWNIFTGNIAALYYFD